MSKLFPNLEDMMNFIVTVPASRLKFLLTNYQGSPVLTLFETARKHVEVHRALGESHQLIGAGLIKDMVAGWGSMTYARDLGFDRPADLNTETAMLQLV